MDKGKVFTTLGITSTKDTNIIKKAYRGKLVQVNPEDDPEGFKLLREAYEEAVRLSKIEDEKDLLDTPITIWIKKVQGVYNKLSYRINIPCWKELFDDEVCKDFDTYTEARDALIEFLMDHFRLPGEVWQLIEDTFLFRDSKEELYEKFPVNFIDFVMKDAESKDWLDYTLFEGDDEADIDGFISLYLSFNRMNNSNEYNEIEEVFEKSKQINLWHPYFEAEKIRYLIANKKMEKAKEISENLQLKKIQDLYVKYYIAEMYLECGDLENAYKECRYILEKNPKHFGAKVLLCKYYLKKEQYEEAKEGYLDLLEVDNYNGSLRLGLQKANTGLIEKFTKKLEKGSNNKALKMELAWCLYQNKLYEECKKLTDNLNIDEEIYFDYYNLMSRVYVENEDYDRAIPCLKKWISEILKIQEDGTENSKRKLKRLGLAYYYMSRCYYHFGIEKQNNEDFKKCIKYIDLAVEAEKGTTSILEYLITKSYALLKLQEDKHCIDVCDEILRIEKGYFPAYLIRQEAYFNLKMAQEVIDDYHNAIEIYAGNPNPYIFAAKVYIIYKQYEDAKIVFDRAKEAGVESNELLFLELKNKRLMAKTNEERKEVAVELDKLYTDAQKELGDLKEIEALLHEQALCYYYMDEDKKALEIIEKKLALKKSIESMLLKGDILYYLKEYKESIKVYKEILKEQPDYSNVYFKMGACYRALDNEERAIDSYLQVIKIDPEHPTVNYELMNIYKKHYMENYEKKDYNTAVEYAKRQVEIEPSCYYYTELGLIYLEGYELNDAIKAFEEAIKKDETNAYPYNNIGYVYKILGEYDKAYEYYKQAIERMGSKDLITHWNMGIYFRSTRQYEKAIETYKMIAAKDDDPKMANKLILEVYKQMKAWQQALEQAKKIFELEGYDELGYLLESGDINSFAGNRQQAVLFYNKAIRKFPKKSKPYIKMGEYIIWIERDKKKALKYFRKAYKVAQKYDSEGIEDALKNIVRALKELGKEKKGYQYVVELYNFEKKRYGSIEIWLNNPRYRKIRLYYMALLNYSIGQYKKTQKYMEFMKEMNNCASCTYCTCYEYLELEGMMLELQKDYPGALEKYERAFELSPDNLHYYYKIKELKEKVK